MEYTRMKKDIGSYEEFMETADKIEKPRGNINEEWVDLGVEFSDVVKLWEGEEAKTSNEQEFITNGFLNCIK